MGKLKHALMNWLGIVLVIVAVIVFFFGSWIGRSYFEAQTYRRLTGVEVTTWDAMWVELRVIEPGGKTK